MYKDAYYILRYHPDREKLLQKINGLDLDLEANQIKKILKKYFGFLSSIAILQIGKETGFSHMTKEQRQEIFEKFEMLRLAIDKRPH